MGAIIWLASYPRSGNTWTRNFLHNITNILEGRAPETQDINAMGQLTTWEIGKIWHEEPLGKPVTEASRDEIAANRMAAQERIAEATQALLFVKTHNALVGTRGHPAINLKVTAGAIYIVRNPLDVAISYASHFGIDIDKAISHLASVNLESPMGEDVVYEIYGSWSQNVESWTRKPHQALYIMRYEDMLADPEKTFGALCRHLLIEPTKDQLKEAIDLSSFERLKAQEAEKGFREKPKQSDSFFRVGKSDQWREQLSRRQVKAVVRAHAGQMERFGYLSDDLRRYV